MSKFFIGNLTECVNQQVLNDTCMNLPHMREIVGKTWSEPVLIDNPAHSDFGKYYIQICPMRVGGLMGLIDRDTTWNIVE